MPIQFLGNCARNVGADPSSDYSVLLSAVRTAAL